MPLPLTSMLLLPILPLVTLFVGLSNFIAGETDASFFQEWLARTREGYAQIPQIFQSLRDINFFANIFEGIKGTFASFFAYFF